MSAPRLLAAATAVALLAGSAACGGAGSPRASGSVVVGLLNTEDAPVGSFPEVRRGAVAAARYIDEALHGVHGRNLEIVSCKTAGTPESSQHCAQQLLSRHPVAVIGGVDLGAAASLPALENAGVPYVGGTPAATAALTSSDAFMLAGGTATEVLGDLAYATRTLHVQRLSTLYDDVPGLLSQAASYLDVIARKSGATAVQLVPVAAGAPDITPALTSVQRSAPDAVLAVFPAQGCARVMQGARALGLKEPLMYPSLCGDARVLSNAGAAAEGAYVASGYVSYNDTGDADVMTYRRALRRYDPSLQPSLLSQAGFSVVMVLRSLLDGLGSGAPSATSLRDALRSTHEHPNFMAHPFTCDGRQLSLLHALCNTYVRVYRVQHGALAPLGGWIDTAPLGRLAGG